MTISAKCLVADRQNIFCVLGRLFRLDAQGKSLRYLRLCTCSVCTKALHRRQRMHSETIKKLARELNQLNQ